MRLIRSSANSLAATLKARSDGNSSSEVFVSLAVGELNRGGIIHHVISI
jgi:hypothetical protein